MHDHKGLKIEPRPTDFVLGANSAIAFKVVLPSGDWTPRIAFYEAQKLAFETDGCVLFTDNESFDAQMDLILPTLPPAIEQQIIEMGFMDTGLDGNSHFHSSPRFIEGLTGNGINGNNLYDGPDVIRKYGILPWKDMPFTPGMTEAEYFTPPTQAQFQKALKFRDLLGGKEFTKYHWVINGGAKNLKTIQTALQQAPLCIGISVGPNWNQEIPADPQPNDPPEHSVMLYKVDGQNAFIYDHYQPAKKTLDANYPIHYVLQMIVSPIIAPPTPAPAVSPIPTNIAPTQKNVDILKALVALYQKLVSLYQKIKGRNLSSNQMNYSLFRSKTFWTLVAGFVINVYQLAAPTLPPAAVGVLDTVVLLLSSYFHLQTGNSTAGSN